MDQEPLWDYASFERPDLSFETAVKDIIIFEKCLETGIEPGEKKQPKVRKKPRILIQKLKIPIDQSETNQAGVVSNQGVGATPKTQSARYAAQNPILQVKPGVSMGSRIEFAANYSQDKWSQQKQKKSPGHKKTATDFATDAMDVKIEQRHYDFPDEWADPSLLEGLGDQDLLSSLGLWPEPYQEYSMAFTEASDYGYETVPRALSAPDFTTFDLFQEPPVARPQTTTPFNFFAPTKAVRQPIYSWNEDEEFVPTSTYIRIKHEINARQVSNQVCKSLQDEFEVENQIAQGRRSVSPPARKRRKPAHYDLTWEPVSIYQAAYTNINVGHLNKASYSSMIPRSSCFGKINMRAKRAWTRGPNRSLVRRKGNEERYKGVFAVERQREQK